jgi:hypothetical protein
MLRKDRRFYTVLRETDLSLNELQARLQTTDTQYLLCEYGYDE